MTSSSSARPSAARPCRISEYPRPSRANVNASASAKRSAILRLDEARIHVWVSLEQARQRGEHQQPGLRDAVATALLQEPATAGHPAHRWSQVAPEEEAERLPERTLCRALGVASTQPLVMGGHPGLLARVIAPDHVRGNRKALQILGPQPAHPLSRRQLGERVTPHPPLKRTAGSLSSIGHGHRRHDTPRGGLSSYHRATILPLFKLSSDYLNTVVGGWMGDRERKRALFDEFGRIGKALASGRRIELLDVLANGERTVEAVAGEVGLSVANTSQHLQILRQAGLVTTRREGTSIHYRLAGPEVFELWRTLRTLAGARLAEVERLAAAYLGAREELEPVTRQELARRLEDGDRLVVLDVRPAAEHAAGHLPGAVSIPVGELRRRLAELPADREIVAYCRGPYCAFAHEAVALLRQEGFSARRLEDGLPEWQAAGLAVARP
jgi:rhodanese-related sulfurtransferase